MRKLFTLSFIAVIGLTACSSGHADTQTSNKLTTAQIAQSEAGDSAKGSLLFFLNPNGRPCQIQDQYLSEIRTQIDEVANIVYIRTTDPNDKSLFYKYGIRSLPSMIILDENENIAQRFSPGIQSSSSILEALEAAL
jgi:thioredoxin 1